MQSLYRANHAPLVYGALLVSISSAHWASTDEVRAGISEANVLVLYNADDGPSGAGYRIANYYQQVHPGAHVVGLTGISSILSGATREQVSGADYLTVIRPQILSALAGIGDSIDVIVTTKGLPLRIDAGVQPAGTSSFKWRRFSSLESELTRIDAIDSIFEMGDQFYLAGFPSFDTTLPSNPYYFNNRPFDRAASDLPNGDIRLASRLDGKNVRTVTAMIDRAQLAFVSPLPQGSMIVADDDPTAGVDQIEDHPAGPGPGLLNVLSEWQTIAESRLADTLGQPSYQFPTPFAQHNDTDEPITTAPGRVIGYVSHGVHDGPGGLDAGYSRGQLKFDLANGAIFQSHESYNAISFDVSHTQSQGLLSEWLEMGGTAGLGHVAEPYNGPDNVSNEDLLYQMLLPSPLAEVGASGLTFVEAAWNATRQLSYVNTVVGDPLMRFYLALPGDVNLDGIVDNKDVAVLHANWWHSAQAPQGDLNGDLVVNELDVEIVQENWLLQMRQGVVTLSSLKIPAPIIDPQTGYPMIPTVRIPEPTSVLLWLSALLVAILRARRRW